MSTQASGPDDGKVCAFLQVSSRSGFGREASRRFTRQVTSADWEEVAGSKTRAMPGQRGHLTSRERRQRNPPPVPPGDGDVRSAENPFHESVLMTARSLWGSYDGQAHSAAGGTPGRRLPASGLLGRRGGRHSGRRGFAACKARRRRQWAAARTAEAAFRKLRHRPVHFTRKKSHVPVRVCKDFP